METKVNNWGGAFEVFVGDRCVGTFVYSPGHTDPIAPYANGYGIDGYIIKTINRRPALVGPIYKTKKQIIEKIIEMAGQ